MREIVGDLWDYHAHGWWVTITTNGFVRRNGEAVMGRGCAAQAAQRCPALPARLGARIRYGGNRLYIWPEWHLLTFPTKHRWWEPADLRLIERSATELRDWLDAEPPGTRVVVPRPGCGNGRLDWRVVRPMLRLIWDERVLVIGPREYRPETGGVGHHG